MRKLSSLIAIAVLLILIPLATKTQAFGCVSGTVSSELIDCCCVVYHRYAYCQDSGIIITWDEVECYG